MILKSCLILIVMVLSLFLGKRIFNAIIVDFKKYIVNFFCNMTLSNEEQEKIENDIKALYRDSSLSQVIKSLDDNKINKDDDITFTETMELLLQIKDYYKEEANIFSRDYSEFLQKINSVFSMYTFSTPFYIAAITYLINQKLSNSPIYFAILLLMILIYFYFLIRVVWIQSFKNGFTKVNLELPFKVKNISIIEYLKNYIISTAIHLKTNRENLLRLKTKIQYIHMQYIVSSVLLILIIMIIYTIK